MTPSFQAPPVPPYFRCSTCRWFKKSPTGLNLGTCKLLPPTPVVVLLPNGCQIGSSSPTVKSDDYCGQHTSIIPPT